MRPEKATIVADLSEKLNKSPFLLVTDYQRMKVDQFSELRNRLAPAGAELRVVKNSFLKRAMSDSGMPDLADKLTGQTAVVLGDKDVAPVAKILKSFAAEFKIAAVKIGVVDRNVLSTAEVESLAELPSREILLSQLLGLLLAPATRLVRILNEPASAFARLLQAKADQGETAVPSAAPEPKPAAEAPAASAAPVEAAQEEAVAAPTADAVPVPDAASAAPETETKG
jgi:large subunit ribosomal protein L10